MKLLEARHPNRLNAVHPRIIEDLIDLCDTSQRAVDAIVLMIEDLLQFGTDSRYAIPLQGTPVWELKTRSRGGQKGGARVYWFPITINIKNTAEAFAVLVNAEAKTGITLNTNKLEEALEIYLAFKSNPKLMYERSS